MAARGNDLTAAATSLCPEIASVLATLEGLPGCRLARMCGSGATCFGLFDTAESWEMEHRYASGVTLVHMDMPTALKRACAA